MPGGGECGLCELHAGRQDWGGELCFRHQRVMWLRCLAIAGWSQIGWMALMEQSLAKLINAVESGALHEVVRRAIPYTGSASPAERVPFGGELAAELDAAEALLQAVADGEVEKIERASGEVFGVEPLPHHCPNCGWHRPGVEHACFNSEKHVDPHDHAHCPQCGKLWSPTLDGSGSYPGSSCDRAECLCAICEAE